MPRRTLEERIAKLQAKQQAQQERQRPRNAVGNPSQAWYVMMACHIALQGFSGRLSINKAVMETTKILGQFQEQLRSEFYKPNDKTIRKHVKFYLAYRKGFTPAARAALTDSQRLALDRLFPAVHAATLVGRVGAMMGGPVSTKAKPHVDLTRQIRDLKTLK